MSEWTMAVCRVTTLLRNSYEPAAKRSRFWNNKTSRIRLSFSTDFHREVTALKDGGGTKRYNARNTALHFHRSHVEN